jgi:ubiquinone/menaquinone biosynthesis C-methylase UbiE
VRLSSRRRIGRLALRPERGDPCYSIVDMLLARLASLATRTGRGRRALWRTWYEFLAARYREPGWTFMNYGYRDPGGSAGPPLAPADEADRSFIQLYDVVARGAPVAGRDLLEIGCGRGGGAAYVAGALSPRRVVGVDLSSRAIALCRRRFVLPNLTFQVGDAERLPFGDGSFDAVLNVESSHCYGRFSAFLGEVRRVLRPDGRFLYADFRPREEVAGWRASLAAAGFAIEAERDLRPGVVAALDADDDSKRDLIGRLVDRPLRKVFSEFAALRGSELYQLLRDGRLAYLGFVLAATNTGPNMPPS